MANEVKETKRWKVEFVGITELGVRDKIATHLIDTTNIAGVKRQLPKLSESLTNYPELVGLIKEKSPKWQTPSEHRHACHYEKDTRLKGSIAGYNIYISPAKIRKPHDWYMPFILLSALAVAIVVGVNTYNQFSNRNLRSAFMSTYPEYGKRVLKVYDEDKGFDYKKLTWVAKDYNREVRGLNRTYVIPEDYTNMISILSANKYRLEYIYLYRNTEEKNDRS